MLLKNLPSMSMVHQVIIIIPIIVEYLLFQRQCSNRVWLRRLLQPILVSSIWLRRVGNTTNKQRYLYLSQLVVESHPVEKMSFHHTIDPRRAINLSKMDSISLQTLSENLRLSLHWDLKKMTFVWAVLTRISKNQKSPHRIRRKSKQITFCCKLRWARLRPIREGNKRWWVWLILWRWLSRLQLSSRVRFKTRLSWALHQCNWLNSLRKSQTELPKSDLSSGSSPTLALVKASTWSHRPNTCKWSTVAEMGVKGPHPQRSISDLLKTTTVQTVNLSTRISQHLLCLQWVSIIIRLPRPYWLSRRSSWPSVSLLVSGSDHDAWLTSSGDGSTLRAFWELL